MLLIAGISFQEEPSVPLNRTPLEHNLPEIVFKLKLITFIQVIAKEGGVREGHVEISLVKVRGRKQGRFF
jgi:hypothetical protein